MCVAAATIHVPLKWRRAGPLPVMMVPTPSLRKITIFNTSHPTREHPRRERLQLRSDAPGG